MNNINPIRDKIDILNSINKINVVNSFRWFALVASTNHALNYVVRHFNKTKYIFFGKIILYFSTYTHVNI